MSRCFPFPPPGYEEKFKAENLDLITKDKHREKKHKKEKKDKEKREHKEKKDKDRNKDRHKEKKDKKEKHKDRKKGKDVIDKGRAPDDGRVENRSVGRNELHIQESSQKAEEVKDSKFTEELGRRTRDDGAVNQLVGSIANSFHRKPEGLGAATPFPEKERAIDKKMLPAHVGSVQRYSGGGPPVEHVPNSLQRRAENISTATSMGGKEIPKLHEKVTISISTESNRNDGIPRPDSTSYSANRKIEYSMAGSGKQKFGEKNAIPNCIESPPRRGQFGEKIVASSSASAQKRNNVMGLPAENLSSRCKTEATVNSSIRNRPEGMCGAVPSTEKERIKGRETFPHPFSSEQRTRTSVGQPMEMDRYQKLDRKVETNEIKKVEDRKVLKDTDHREKRSKPNDADGPNYEKEKEEKIAKAEKVEIDKTRNFSQKGQVDALHSKPLAPHKDNTTGIRDVDETNKKRKDIKTNGFLHEKDARPSKMPRLLSSSQPPANDRTLESLHLDAPVSLSLKEEAMNKLKSDRKLDNNVKKLNGTANSQHLGIEARPPAAKHLLENGDASSRSPHPDSAYLHQIHSVPKMEAWPEVDDLDWLFRRHDSQQERKAEREAEAGAPRVWAEALRIDSADVLALPYVVPF